MKVIPLAIAIAAFGLAAAAAPARAPGGQLEQGRGLYVSMGCFQCHGRAGQGSTFSGPALAPAPLGPAQFYDLVRNPRGQMPSYSPAILSEPQLDAIYAYVRSIPIGRGPDQIPLLASQAPEGPQPGGNAARGAGLFAANCAACHGARLEGGLAASLTAEPVKRNARATMDLIMNPPRGMPKLHPSPLSTADVADIAAFVRERP